MKIAYLARVDAGNPSGVLKKIDRQFRYWLQAGHEVRLFALSRPWQDIWSGLEGIDISPYQTGSYLDLFRRGAKAVADIRVWQPDLIYWRYSSAYPGLPGLMSQFPTVVEINTHYDREYLAVNRIGYLLHRLTSRSVYRRAAGFVVLTEELSEWVAGYKKPTLVLGDSVDLDSIPSLPPNNDDQPRLVCMATRPYPWIALDKIVVMARLFPSWHFDIAGLDSDALGSTPVPENMVFHGYLEGNDLVRVLARADVAIGTLGLHRIGLEQMAPLKLREYLAYGLPAIIAYQDTDFPEGASFLLQLPNVENNLAPAQAKIDEFVGRWQGSRVPRESIPHLDAGAKEDQRLAFLAKVVSRPG
jgi:hypothetical protein